MNIVEMPLEHTLVKNYRVKIQKICPAIPENNLVITNDNSIVGVSISTPAVIGNKILSIFDFLYKHGLTNINLLMGDSIYKYTSMIINGCDENEGKSIATKHSDELMQYFKAYIEENEKPFKLNFLPSSMIEPDDNFEIICNNLWALFDANAQFRQSVLNFSKSYFSRALKNSSFNVEKYLECSYQYLIEEIAIFAILNKRGFNTLLYPGTIQTIYDVIKMDDPYLSSLFEGYIFVSLRLK